MFGDALYVHTLLHCHWHHAMSMYIFYSYLLIFLSVRNSVAVAGERAPEGVEALLEGDVLGGLQRGRGKLRAGGGGLFYSCQQNFPNVLQYS